LLGEKEFTITFHQGQETNIHISLITQNALLAMIFDNKLPIGAIRFWAKKTGAEIKSVIEEAEKRASSQSQKVINEDIGKDIEDLFRKIG